MTNIAVDPPSKERMVLYPGFLMEAYLEGGATQERLLEALRAVFHRTPGTLQEVQDMARDVVDYNMSPIPFLEEFNIYTSGAFTVTTETEPTTGPVAMVILSDDLQPGTGIITLAD